MRHLSIAALTFFALLFGATAAQAEVKLAFVDMQRALLEVKEGKAAKKKLEKMKKSRQADLDKKQEELKNLQKNFEAQKDFMKPEVRKQKEEEFRKKLADLQLTYAKLQKELAMEEAKLTKGIFARMGRILAKMGKAQGLTMVFEKTESSILWAPQSLDLTNEVIRRFDAGEGKASKKKK
jgi:outer membrane protein